MSKTLDQLTFKEVILNAIARKRDYFDENYDFDCYNEENPYGDTWVVTSQEPTDESLERADEEFKETFDVDDFIADYLAEDADFKALIKYMVENERY